MKLIRLSIFSAFLLASCVSPTKPSIRTGNFTVYQYNALGVVSRQWETSSFVEDFGTVTFESGGQTWTVLGSYQIDESK